MPSSTPAGTFTDTVRRARTRPSPPQLPHGCGITVPMPAQVGHGRLVITWPRKDRCTLCTSPRPLAGVAGGRVGARRGAGAGAGRADHRGVDGEVPGGAERGLGQLQVQPDQRVRALPDPAARAARGGRAEEGVHDVAEAAEAGAERAAGRAAAGRQRVAAEVHDLPLLRVGQHLVRRRDLLEALLRRRVRVDVRVQLPGELAVGPLDLLARRVPAHPEHAVVIRRHDTPASWHSVVQTASLRVGTPCSPGLGGGRHPAGSGRPVTARRAPRRRRRRGCRRRTGPSPRRCRAGRWCSRAASTSSVIRSAGSSQDTSNSSPSGSLAYSALVVAWSEAPTSAPASASRPAIRSSSSSVSTSQARW